jgi:glucose uptake protein
MFPQSIGMFLPAILIFFFEKDNSEHNLQKEIFNKKVFMNMLPGTLQAVGNLALILSIALVSNVIASPINQLSVVIGTLLGIFVMKEKKPKPYTAITLIGLALIATGAIMSSLT